MTNEFRRTLRALTGVSILIAGLLALSPAAVAQSQATLTNPTTGATTNCTIQSSTITWNGAISVTCTNDPSNLGGGTPTTPTATITLNAAVGNLTTTGNSSATITANCASATSSCPGVAIQLAVVSPTGVTLSGSTTHTFTAPGASPAFTVSSAGGIAVGAAQVRLTVTAAGSGVTTNPNIGNTTGITANISIVDNSPAVATNVALASTGAVASASSEFGAAQAASAANNGDRTGAGLAFWADATPGSFPDYVQIVFNGAKVIDRVVVYSMQDSYASPVEPTDVMTFASFGLTSFIVEGWNGSSWVNLGTVTGNNLVKRTVTFSAFTTDRIRVVVNGAGDGYSRIVEVEAFGIAATGGGGSGGGGGSSTACSTSATFMQTAGTVTNQYFFGSQEGMGISGTQSIAVAFKPVTDYQNGVIKYGGTEAVQQLAGNNASRDIQHVISLCPGEFSGVNPPGASGICSRFGTDGGGGISFHTANSPTVQINSCGPLDPTKTYYINARYVNPATGTTTCIASGGLCYTVIGLQPQ